MRVVVVGGTGLIGSALVQRLREAGHEAVPASPSTGVDTLTGAGVADVLAGAAVVVDVTNSPSFEDGPVLDFFTRSTRTLLAAEREAGVRHHVALSIVGTDRVPESGYLRAKCAQEELIRAGGVPFTIVRATQFFEFLAMIGAGAAVGDAVVLPDADLQPIAAADVSAALAEVASAVPVNGHLDLAGPDRRPFTGFIGPVLAGRGDARVVTSSSDATYFGAVLERDSLVPTGRARIARTGFAEWEAGRPARV